MNQKDKQYLGHFPRRSHNLHKPLYVCAASQFPIDAAAIRLARAQFR
jgi:hypothetical protein